MTAALLARSLLHSKRDSASRSEPICGNQEFVAGSSSCEREVRALFYTQLPLPTELPALQPWQSNPVRAFVICKAPPFFFFLSSFFVLLPSVFRVGFCVVFASSDLTKGVAALLHSNLSQSKLAHVSICVSVLSNNISDGGLLRCSRAEVPPIIVCTTDFALLPKARIYLQRACNQVAGSVLSLSSNRLLCWILHCVGKLTCCTLNRLRYLLVRGSSAFQQRVGVCGAAGIKSFCIKAMLSEQGRNPLSFPPIICFAGFCVASQSPHVKESLRQAVIAASASFQHISI